MKSQRTVPIEEALRRSNELLIQFCGLEVDVGNAILDHVEANPRGPHRADSIARARMARDALVQFLPRIQGASSVVEVLRAGLETFEARLVRLEERVVGHGAAGGPP